MHSKEYYITTALKKIKEIINFNIINKYFSYSCTKYDIKGTNTNQDEMEMNLESIRSY